MAAKQVLEFTLNDDQYCIGIEYVTEIVRRSEDEVRSMPNAPPHVEGVMDLRGETTTIIDVGEVLSLDKTDGNDRDKVIVFNDGETADENIGWAVDDVIRVSTIETENVEDVDEKMMKGIINRDEGFLIWTAPEEIATEEELTA